VKEKIGMEEDVEGNIEHDVDDISDERTFSARDMPSLL
jgi:hypothetical protein